MSGSESGFSSALVFGVFGDALVFMVDFCCVYLLWEAVY